LIDSPPVWGCRVLAAYPHDPDAFTQGLVFVDGCLFESTGHFGRSSVRQVELESGRVLRSATLPADVFGEGIAAWGDDIVGITWRNGTVYRWDRATLRCTGEWPQPGEGWGLTQDGRRLVMSDGTSRLRFLDPATMREQSKLAVTAAGRPVGWLNALQWVEGEIFANILALPALARIDPASGRVNGWIDLRALVREASGGDPEKVANGIAWDEAEGRLFVTGKNWPSLYHIALVPPQRAG